MRINEKEEIISTYIPPELSTFYTTNSASLNIEHAILVSQIYRIFFSLY